MQLFISALVGFATMLSTQTAAAATFHEPYSQPGIRMEPGEPHKAISFSVQLDQQGMDKRICLIVENPGRKNVYVTLNGPDGSSIDDFYTGKKMVRLNKIYNFSFAEEGLYSIEVRCGHERIKKQIRLGYAGERPVDKLTIE